MLRRFFRTASRGRSETTPVALLSGVTLAVALIAGVVIVIALVAWYAAR